MFDGTVGTWQTSLVDIHLKEPDYMPYHAKPYPVPHSQEWKLKEEVNRLCEQGILQKINKPVGVQNPCALIVTYLHKPYLLPFKLAQINIQECT